MDSESSTPTAPTVACRALILAAVTCRGHLEGGLDEPSTHALHTRILNWLETCKLTEALEPEERAILLAPKGALEEAQRLEAIRKVEGAAILGWALGKYPLPPLEVQVEPFKVGDALGFLWAGATDIIRYPKLRSRGELNAYHGLIKAIHQRLSEVALRPQRGDFASCIPVTWLRTLGLYRSSPLVEGDLSIGGQPLHQVDPDLLHTLTEIARERYRAASWLAGERVSYWD